MVEFEARDFLTVLHEKYDSDGACDNSAECCLLDIFQYAPGSELITKLAIVLCEFLGGVLGYV